MRPPKWWNSTVASAVLVLAIVGFVLYVVAVVNNYVNQRWGP